MSRTESIMVELGSPVPDFALPDVRTGSSCRPAELLRAAPHRKGLLVLFVCVHCPYVKHVELELGRIGRDYYGADGQGPIAIAAIQSNDLQQYPQDGPEGMREQADRCGWTFPYLLDQTQQVARDFQAACTPDIFLFDSTLRLVYRGQLDSSRPRRGDFGNDEPVTGVDLRRALDDLLAGRTPSPDQRSSLGCNIKFR